MLRVLRRVEQGKSIIRAVVEVLLGRWRLKKRLARFASLLLLHGSLRHRLLRRKRRLLRRRLRRLRVHVEWHARRLALHTSTPQGSLNRLANRQIREWRPPCRPRQVALAPSCTAS